VAAQQRAAWRLQAQQAQGGSGLERARRSRRPLSSGCDLHALCQQHAPPAPSLQDPLLLYAFKSDEPLAALLAEQDALSSK
jgi:hypothetical protein